MTKKNQFPTLPPKFPTVPHFRRMQFKDLRCVSLRTKMGGISIYYSPRSFLIVTPFLIITDYFIFKLINDKTLFG
jgi:hypothetical protein